MATVRTHPGRGSPCHSSTVTAKAPAGPFAQVSSRACIGPTTTAPRNLQDTIRGRGAGSPRHLDSPVSSGPRQESPLLHREAEFRQWRSENEALWRREKKEGKTHITYRQLMFRRDSQGPPTIPPLSLALPDAAAARHTSLQHRTPTRRPIESNPRPSPTSPTTSAPTPQPTPSRAPSERRSSTTRERARQ